MQGSNGTDIKRARKNEEVILKKCAKFTDCISKKNNIKASKATCLDVVMPLYNLLECSSNYSKNAGGI